MAISAIFGFSSRIPTLYATLYCAKFWRPLCQGRGTISAMKWLFPWMSEHVPFENMCPCGGIFTPFATIRLFSNVDSKPASLIARVVALWANKRFVSAVNSHVGFQIGKFGTRVAALVAIVSFLWLRMNIVDFGHIGNFRLMSSVS